MAEGVYKCPFCYGGVEGGQKSIDAGKFKRCKHCKGRGWFLTIAARNRAIQRDIQARRDEECQKQMNEPSATHS